MQYFFWIIIGSIILAICAKNKNGTQTQSKSKKKEVVRICHRHYYAPDDYECTVCEARFDDDIIVCPECGARFTTTEEDDTEYYEEMDEEEDWDEENGL